MQETDILYLLDVTARQFCFILGVSSAAVSKLTLHTIDRFWCRGTAGLLPRAQQPL